MQGGGWNVIPGHRIDSFKLIMCISSDPAVQLPSVWSGEIQKIFMGMFITHGLGLRTLEATHMPITGGEGWGNERVLEAYTVGYHEHLGKDT